MIRSTLALMVLLVAALLVACGQQEQPVDESLPEAMQAFSDDGDVAELTIEGNDLMQFDKKRMTVRPGQMVRLTLRHTGQLPAQAMGHNVVILEQGEDVFEFGADVGQAGGSLDNDYLPVSVRDRVVAFTKLIGGGETTTVEFRAPQEPGEYPFLCSFPGHFGQMNGIFEVQG
jgi:azurin